MSINQFITRIEKVERIAKYSKFRRMLENPLKYMKAIVFRELIYKLTQKKIEVKADTFFNDQMYVALPAGTEIYLTGGKSHDAEIRLVKFLINYLKSGQTFVDIGAHFGYFTLLASKLVSDSGKVLAFEPSKSSFDLLRKNSKRRKNISIHNKAISLTNGTIEFNEFSNLYSEYSSINAEQFINESWYKYNPPKKTEIESIRLDDFLAHHSIRPDMIKIDVEGAEYDVIRGLVKFPDFNKVILVMEYLCEERGNRIHQKACILLRDLGFATHVINSDGGIDLCPDIEKYLKKAQLETDNIVFVH